MGFGEAGFGVWCRAPVVGGAGVEGVAGGVEGEPAFGGEGGVGDDDVGAEARPGTFGEVAGSVGGKTVRSEARGRGEGGYGGEEVGGVGDAG